MNVVIESNIPMPAIGANRSGVAAIMRSLAVGDSFLWPEAKRNSIYQVAKTSTPKAKYVIRKVKDGQIRVWRAE